MKAATTRRAFTLVEILLVIGIIAVLIGLLMPVLARARESARRLQCMSNLRQLTWAMIAYTNDNQGWFPGPGTGHARLDQDWLYWQTRTQPRDLQQSRIAKYLPSPLNTSLLVCPSDENASRRKRNWYFTADNGYPFSYSASPNVLGDPKANLPGKKFGSIHQSAEQILLADESELTINDAMFSYLNHAPMWDLLAIRHDRFMRDPPTPSPDQPMKNEPTPNSKGRGNVSFVDGHVEFATREQVHGKDEVVIAE